MGILWAHTGAIGCIALTQYHCTCEYCLHAVGYRSLFLHSQIFEVNVKSAALLVKEALPHLRASGLARTTDSRVMGNYSNFCGDFIS